MTDLTAVRDFIVSQIDENEATKEMAKQAVIALFDAVQEMLTDAHRIADALEKLAELQARDKCSS